MPVSYCGSPPAQVMQAPDANGPYVYNGVDRKDPEAGYETANCLTACGTCNKAKGGMTFDAWMTWLASVTRFRSQPIIESKAA